MSFPAATRRHRAYMALATVGWLIAAVVISVGGAGLVSGAQHVPGDATRPELTWVADQAATSALRKLDAPMAVLSGNVNSLGDDARTALADLVAQRDDLLAQDLQHGDALAGQIKASVATLRPALARVPYADRPEQLGTAAASRLAAAQAALDAGGQLPSLWHSLTAATEPSVHVTTALQAHDQYALAAVRDGSAGRYPQALEELAKAVAQLETATAIRDQLQNDVDVSTLSTWIDRNAAYDTALQRLYTAAEKAGGKSTPAVTSALTAVRQAQTNLPPDTRGLVVIMGDLAQGGLNQTVIAIERARGDLAAAVAALH